MKIIALQAENIKKLVAVEIRPDGNMVEITGANGQGKTSVLDSIWWALSGTAHIQGEPIRAGQNKAKIKLDLGEIVITRNFKKSGDDEYTSSLTVENAEGVKFPSPQRMLDDLLGQLSFDPLAFARSDAKTQFNTLRQFVPDVDFDGIDHANQIDYDKRRFANMKANEARAAADNIQVSTGGNTQSVDTAALINKMTTVASVNADIQVRANNRLRMAKDAKDARAAAAAARIQADGLDKTAAELEAKLAGAKPLPPETSVEELRQQIADAEKSNGDIMLRRQKIALIDKAQKHEEESTFLTEAMSRREVEKRKKIEAAKLPVNGISFGKDQILLNGVPFDQASDAEQLRTSIAIAMALNPKLRVIRVRDGSLLDENSMKLLASMADENDFQVWCERVDVSGKVGFVLENGHLKN